MTDARKNLIRDAFLAGYQVNEAYGGYLITRSHGKGKTGIMLYEDGTAVRVDVRLDVAKGMRSYKDMRLALGI